MKTKHLEKNLFIVMEGLDGVGKTTIAHAVVQELHTNGIRAIYTNGILDLYQPIRTNIHLLKNVQASYFFYISALCASSSLIIENLQHSWVICDRYFYSTNAYHLARGLKATVPVETLGLPKPDAVFNIIVDDPLLRAARIRNSKRSLGNTELRPLPEQAKILNYLDQLNFIKIDNSSDNVSRAVSEIVSYITSR